MSTIEANTAACDVRVQGERLPSAIINGGHTLSPAAPGARRPACCALRAAKELASRVAIPTVSV